MSYAHSPINTLPSDVLHIVLSIAAHSELVKRGPRAVRPSRAFITALSSVCIAWRELMLHSCTFWTSPELVLEGTASKPSYELARLWSQRSGDAVLDLYVFEYKDSPASARQKLVHQRGTIDRARTASSQLASPNWTTSAVYDLMTMLMARVRALNVCANKTPDKDPFTAVLNLWATQGTVGLAEYIDVWSNTEPGMETRAPHTPDDIHINIDADAFAGFFRSLHGLVIHRTFIPLDGLVHAGLVELRIQTIHYTHNTTAQGLRIPQICNMLATASRLRVLVIIAACQRRPTEPLRVVTLDYLETLILEGADEWLLLGAITSASKDIKASLTLGHDRTCLPMIQAFLSRTNVTRLKLNAPETGLGWDPIVDALTCIPHMPRLEALALSFFDLPTEEELETIQTSSGNLCPALREVHLDCCFGSLRGLKRLLPIHTLDKFVWSAVPPEDDNDILSSLPDANTRAAVERMMSEHGVEVVWIPWSFDRPIRAVLGAADVRSETPDFF